MAAAAPPSIAPPLPATMGPQLHRGRDGGHLPVTKSDRDVAALLAVLECLPVACDRAWAGSNVACCVPSVGAQLSHLLLVPPLPVRPSVDSLEGLTQLTEERLMEFKECFDLFDPHGIGYVSMLHFGTMARCLGQNPSPGQLEGWGTVADPLGQGVLYFPHFAEVFHLQMRDDGGEDDLREAFRVFAKPDGTITVAEIRDVLFNLGEKLDDNMISDVVGDFIKCELRVDVVTVTDATTVDCDKFSAYAF
jgi:calmodulin